MKLVYLALSMSVLLANVAHAKGCSSKDAEAAEAATEHLDSWKKVSENFKKFGHCDDGVVAEGNSEAVARLLVDHWNTLSQLNTYFGSDLALKRFVIRHVDATLDTEDVKKIAALSSSSCPNGMTTLCDELNAAASRALKEMTAN